jgi:acyl-CoA thioesterase FadM
MTATRPDLLPARVELPYRVRFDEATPDGLLRGSALLGYVQDLAWHHSEVLGFSRAWYRERNLAWLVRAIEATLHAPIPDNGVVLVSTRISGWRRVMARRMSDAIGADGTLRATVLIDWAMTDGTAPVRIPDEFIRTPFDAPGPFAPIRVALPPTPPDAAVLRLVPRLRELDPMGHANNGVYLDWLDEAVAAAGGRDAVVSFPRRYRLEYLRPAGPGTNLVSAAWQDGSGWAYRLAAGDGTELLRGRLDPGGLDPT